jgi:hypothetical protein
VAQRVRRRVRDDSFRETLAPTQPYASPVIPVNVRPRTSYYTFANLVYLVFGLLEASLAFRFFFLLFGANPNSGFVSFIYTISQPFVAPFYNIFGSVSGRSGTLVIFDPSTLVAAIVYGVIGWALIRLLAAGHNRPTDSL